VALERISQGVNRVARLLLVEDEPTQLDLYARFLAREGYEIKGANCGREAIEMAKSFRPSVVVMDLMLPDMDGTEAISRLLAECGRRPKIVINTCHEKYRYDFRCWGADAFVLKSSDPGELIEKIGQVLKDSDITRPGRESRN
jgi:two-component system OmpR family response regulator